MSNTPQDPVPTAELAALGPYFAVETHGPDTRACGPWEPLGSLLGSASALRSRAEQVRAALAGGRPPESVEFRVAASVAHLGLTARLMAPALGAAAVTGSVLAMGQARWIPATGSLFRLSVPDGARRSGDMAGEITRDLLEGPVRALVETVAAMSVSRQVLWGNVASAINGATAMITAARPDRGADAAAIASALLRAPDLADSYQGAPGAGFRRRNCCLIYRIGPGGSVCGDCVIRGRGSATP